MPQGVPKWQNGVRNVSMCLPRAVEVGKAHFQRAGPQIGKNIVRITNNWGDLVLNADSEDRKGLIWVPKTQPVNYI